MVRLSTAYAIFGAISSMSLAIASTERLHPSLASLALQKTLNDASPIFGDYTSVKSKTSMWMSHYPDNTLIVHMNLPGAHDAATWNYSLTTQELLLHDTSLVNITEVDPRASRCQTRSMVDMLNDGLRVFDLRYAFDVTNSTLVFWHGSALQSETAAINDVLFGYYQWLDEHPSEAIFLSFMYQGGTTLYAQDNADVQRLLFDALTTPAAEKYILQTKNTLGTLGEARGKVTLLKRFDLEGLPAYFTEALPGVHFPPAQWTNNAPNITLVFNNKTGEEAFIEDLFQPAVATTSPSELSIALKFNATVQHLRLAASGQHPNSLFWGFASSTNLFHSPPITPQMQAVGNGTLLPTGVNQQLIPVFSELAGKRLGIVMFDFYETPSNLISTFLNVLPPPPHR